MLWLIKREYWENKGLLVWVPLVVSVLMLIFLWTIAWKQASGLGEVASVSSDAGALLSQDLRLQMNLMWIKEFFQLFATPLFYLSAASSIFYLMSSLHLERQDKSILFWKSLPISDLQTVLSKMVLPLLVCPLLCFSIAFAMYLLSALMFCLLYWFKGISVFDLVFLNRDFLLQPTMIFSMIPMYMMWALPTVAWLLLVSAWAKSRVMPWAYGLPLLTYFSLISVDSAFQLNWSVSLWGKTILLRLLGGTLPGSWAVIDSVSGKFRPLIPLESYYDQAWQHMFSMEMFLGIAAAGVMLFIAIRIRRFGDSTR
jgi:ABC-2 type transport system permease protein